MVSSESHGAQCSVRKDKTIYTTRKTQVKSKEVKIQMSAQSTKQGRQRIHVASGALTCVTRALLEALAFISIIVRATLSS
jgi:hypothetical protein